MEQWEAAYITKNLEILIKNTRCTAAMKAGLKARELLTDDEDERLTAVGRNEGLISEAKMLYEILMTRSRGYNGLMEVLRNARQDGALNILLEGFQQPQPQAASADSITQLLNIRVQLANCTKSFNDVFPNFTVEDARKLIQQDDLLQELEEIFRQGSFEVKLDGEIPLTSDLYIPRLLSNRLRLDPGVFSLKSCEDVFVFTNIDIKVLTQLVKPHAVRFSTGQRSLVTGRHIFLEDDGDWDDMVGISEAAIHLISKDNGGYILQRTTKVTDAIQKHLLRDGRNKETFVTEAAFVQEFVSDNDSKGVLICDVAGMGKTWLMRRLASKIRDRSQKVVTLFLELASFSKFLSGKKPRDKEALNTFLQYVCHSKLANHLLHKYAAKYGLKILFVLDGYDEVSNDDMEVVKSSLEVLSKLDHIRLIISARPNMRAILQQTFNLIAYDILRFYKEEQIRCIIEQWVHSCHQSDSEFCKVKEFAIKCVKSVKSIQNDKINDILGVPLKCRLLAAINEKQAKQLCKANRRKQLQIVEAAAIKCVFDLYTKYVDCLIDKVAETLPMDAKKNFEEGILTFYTNMALELLFPDLLNVYQKNFKIDSSMEEHICRVGVACVNNVNQRLEFLHRSFAEYFVGRFFAEFWNDIEQFSPSFVQMVGPYFIKNVMIAVDGAFKIKPDTYNKTNAWWDLIKCKPWHSSNGLSSFLYYKKVFLLKYPLLLLFMNMNLKVNKLQVGRLERLTDRFRNVTMSFETSAIATTKNTQPVDRNASFCNELCGFKKWLAEASFATMVACIDERLTNIFSLYVQILILFFDRKDRVALLLPNNKDQYTESTESAVLLLCKAAMSKSPENAVELFKLFGDSEENFLSPLCQRYPQQYWSPLEVAIITEDFDMTFYFQDKVSLPVCRLFIACVAVHKKLDEADTKLKIMKMVLGSSDMLCYVSSLHFLCMDSLDRSKDTAVRITKYSFQLLLKFWEDSKRSMSSIKNENKIFILEQCLENCNDEELINLLLSLYGNGDDKKPSIVNLAGRRTFTAEEVLDALDLVQVRDAFSKVNLDYLAIDNCLNLETLKVLTAIQPDFSRNNIDRWNYLHVAAYTLKIDWVNYLILSGYEVDQLDTDGAPPLLCAADNEIDNQSMLAVTRLLVENGANAYAKDSDGQNVAHRVFYDCRKAKSKDLCEWVSYLLANGYHQLWEMRDNDGRTPQETLIHSKGKNNPLTTEVLTLLESYSVVSSK